MSEYSVFEAFVLYFVWRVRNRTILSRKTYDIATNILKERGINIEEALEEIDFESFEKAYYE